MEKKQLTPNEWETFKSDVQEVIDDGARDWEIDEDAQTIKNTSGVDLVFYPSGRAEFSRYYEGKNTILSVLYLKSGDSLASFIARCIGKSQALRDVVELED